MSGQRFSHPAIYRCLPFAAFMAFVGLEDVIGFSAAQGFITLGDTTLLYLYPVKTLIAAGVLYRYRSEYRELTIKNLANLPTTLSLCGAGLLVFVLWIQLDWTLGKPQGFNPTLLPGQDLQIVMIMSRVAGAVLVVPLIEELFWRSFLIRYIIDSDFQKVPLGAYTRASFLLTVVLFALEHHYILAGLMAGAVYNLILYRTRSIAQCILAHAITNLALAIYVLNTGNRQYW